jgi:1-acyl-sn-glycerol-3-phosphate acyltransferase
VVFRSVLFTVLMFVSVVPWSMVVVVGRLHGYPTAYGLVVRWVRAVVWLAKVLCGLRYRVEGLGNLPRESSVVLLKHSSAYETLVQFLIFPRQTWVLKRELTWAPFLGWAVAAVRPIAIDRRAGQQAVGQVLAQGRARLAEGLWVMIFPEGTRMPPGQTRKYGISGALLAKESGRLVVPVAHNAGDFWPRRGWRKRAGTVTFRIGQPIDPADRDPRDVNGEVQRWIEAEVAKLRSGSPGS